MVKQETTDFVNDAPITAELLYANGILARNEEEAQVLCMYRKLNEINQISITSRIEGMLEAQMYMQMSEK